jgi:hypothetical protein
MSALLISVLGSMIGFIIAAILIAAVVVVWVTRNGSREPDPAWPVKMDEGLVPAVITNQEMILEMAINTRDMMKRGEWLSALVALNAMIDELRDPIDLQNPSPEATND